MIRKLLACAIVVLCVGVIASPASAVLYTYNRGGHKWDPIRVTQTIYSGWNITRIVTQTDPVTKCTTTTTTYYAFWIQTGEAVSTVCPE